MNTRPGLSHERRVNCSLTKKQKGESKGKSAGEMHALERERQR